MPKTAKPVTGVYEKQPGSGLWYVRIRIKGKLIRKAIGTRQQAIEYAEKQRTIHRTGTGVVPTTAKKPAQTFAEIEKTRQGTTVGQLIDEYLAWQEGLNEDHPERLTDQAGMRQRLLAMKEALGDRVAVSLKVGDIKVYLDSLYRKPATMNRYKSCLSAVYTYARTIDSERIHINPVRDLKHYTVASSLPRFMTDDEETKIRTVLQKWINETPENHRLTRLLLQQHPNELTVAVGTGIRKGNQYALRWPDIHFKAREIYLPKTKNGDPHIVPMIDDVYRALISQRSILRQIDAIKRKETGKTRHAHAGDRVFSIEENRTWWAKAKKEAGVGNLNWHQCSRHTAGSRLGQNKVPLAHIAGILGHKTLEMAKRYTHLEKSHLAEAMVVLNRARSTA